LQSHFDFIIVIKPNFFKYLKRNPGIDVRNKTCYTERT